MCVESTPDAFWSVALDSPFTIEKKSKRRTAEAGGERINRGKQEEENVTRRDCDCRNEKKIRSGGFCTSENTTTSVCWDNASITDFYVAETMELICSKSRIKFSNF